MAAKSIIETVTIGTRGLLADEETLLYELRDFFAHRTTVLGDDATAKQLFDDVFKNVPVNPRRK